MALNKDMLSLIENIKQPIVFYLPRKPFENIIEIDISPLDKIGYFNSLFVTDNKGETKMLSNGFGYIQLTEKTKILKANLFELIELRSKLDKKAFYYLIDDYFIELNNWVMITDSVRKNAKTEANNYKSYVQNYLELQYNSLKEHQTKLEAQFREWKSWYEIDIAFKFSPYDLEKSEYKSNSSFTSKKPNKKTVIQPKTILKETVQKTLINEADVDKHLLESVFNVDFTRIDNTKT